MNARDFTFEPNAKIAGRMQALAGIGAATLVAGLLWAPQRTWLNLLLVSYYLLGLALAGWRGARSSMSAVLTGALPFDACPKLWLACFRSERWGYSLS
jgi:hypothetical protein